MFTLQIWEFWRPHGHHRPFPLRHALLERRWSHALPHSSRTLHIPAHPAAEWQVMLVWHYVFLPSNSLSSCSFVSFLINQLTIVFILNALKRKGYWSEIHIKTSVVFIFVLLQDYLQLLNLSGLLQLSVCPLELNSPFLLMHPYDFLKKWPLLWLAVDWLLFKQGQSYVKGVIWCFFKDHYFVYLV